MNETNNSAAPNAATTTAEMPVGEPSINPASSSSGVDLPLPISWLIGGVVLLVILFIAKKKGLLDRIRFFFLQTREELAKCSWPTRDELKGSTWMVLAAVFMLGFFTFMADLLLGDMFIQRFLLEYLAKGGATI
ncbi:MAG: preprotein translocase subunit SecE [Verrucomicrobiota bacterium]|nr:preprotein translocase subunit SecE [Verrucomicrobiota bacterium]